MKKIFTSMALLLCASVSSVNAATYKSDFTNGQVVLMDSISIDGYMTEGWVEHAGTATKSAKFTINTSGEIESTNSGVKYYNVKQESSKSVTIYVTGVSSIKACFFHSGSSGERTVKYKLNSGNETSLVTLSAKSTGSGSIELDATKENSIKFYASGDCAFLGFVTTVESSSETVDVTLASSGWSTFSSADKAIDFSGVEGVKAYTAVYNEKDDNVTMTEFTGVLAAGNGVVLIGTSGETYSLPVSKEAGTTPESNDLVAVTSATTVPCPTAAPYFYALSGGKFHPFDSEGCSFADGKAYLSCSRAYKTSSSAKAISIVFADDATGINEVSAAQKSAKIYNLQGIEVKNADKGLFIINGKKVIK